MTGTSNTFNQLILHASKNWLLPEPPQPEHLDKTPRSSPWMVFKDPDLRLCESQGCRTLRDIASCCGPTPCTRMDSSRSHLKPAEDLNTSFVLQHQTPRFGLSTWWAVLPSHPKPHQPCPAPPGLTTHLQSDTKILSFLGCLPRGLNKPCSSHSF